MVAAVRLRSLGGPPPFASAVRPSRGAYRCSPSAAPGRASSGAGPPAARARLVRPDHNPDRPPGTHVALVQVLQEAAHRRRPATGPSGRARGPLGFPWPPDSTVTAPLLCPEQRVVLGVARVRTRLRRGCRLAEQHRAPAGGRHGRTPAVTFPGPGGGTAGAGRRDRYPGDTYVRSGPGRQLLREVRAAAKTALAVHWAHRVKDRFSGGQLFVNLRGYSPGDPVSAADALEAMLRSLNVAPERIPAGTDARSVLLRSELACRKILLLLDNARDSDQVRCLIPGGDALVLVTSRAKLRAPAARDGARHKTLGVLPPADAIELLSRAIGPGRVAAEPPQPRWPGFRRPEPRRPWPSSPTPACSNGSPPATTSSTACSTSTPASRARHTTPTRTPPSADSSCGMCTPRRPPARGRAAAPSPTYASRDVPASGVAPLEFTGYQGDRQPRRAAGHQTGPRPPADRRRHAQRGQCRGAGGARPRPGLPPPRPPTATGCWPPPFADSGVTTGSPAASGRVGRSPPPSRRAAAGRRTWRPQGRHFTAGSPRRPLRVTARGSTSPRSGSR